MEGIVVVSVKIKNFSKCWKSWRGLEKHDVLTRCYLVEKEKQLFSKLH